MGISGGPYVIRDSSLVLDLDAADKTSYTGSGDGLWRDLTISNVVGTLTNGPTFNSAFQGSIVLDGTNDHINPNIKAWISSTTAALTICAFLKPSSITDRYIIQQSSGNGVFALVMGAHGGVSSNTLGFFAKLSDANFYAVSNSLATAKWTHVCGTYVKGSSVSFYENGVLTNTRAVPNLNLNTDFPTIASSIGCYDSANPSFFFPGEIASIQIYNRLLSEQEIQNNYISQKSRFGL